eukprot:1899862-Alexandrium_andersonii.AAC.1
MAVLGNASFAAARTPPRLSSRCRATSSMVCGSPLRLMSPRRLTACSRQSACESASKPAAASAASQLPAGPTKCLSAWAAALL